MYELSEEEKKIWEYLQQKPATLKHLSEKFKMSTSAISRRLKNISLAGKPLKEEQVGNKNVILYSCATSLDEVVASSGFIPPSTTFDNPIEITLQNSPDYNLGFANTVFAGGKTNKKLFRNFLKYCSADEVDAIVITGNLMWLDLTNYSKYTPDRSESSGIDIDPLMIKYPKSVIESGRDPKRLLEGKKPVYLTFKERLDLAVEKSLKPLFLNDEGKPIYQGPVYVIFGEMEEELSRQQANEAVKKEKTKEAEAAKAHLSELKGELKVLRKDLKQHEKDMSKEGTAEKELENTLKAYETAKTSEEMLVRQITDWQEYISTRLTMKSTDENFINLSSDAIKGYIIDKIESSIPNCKVISTGDGYLKANGKIIKVVYSSNKLSEKPGDNLMDKLVEGTRVNLSQNKESPDLVVAGGLSATYTYVPIAYVDETGEHTISLLQLPTCLNEESLEAILQAKVKAGGNSLSKLANLSDFNSGAVIVGSVNGIQKRKLLLSEYLTNDKAFAKPQKIKDHKMFFEANFSDQHHGSKYVSIVETADNIKYAFEIAQAILDEWGAPIVKINSLGDEIQEKNYDTEAENHPDYLYPEQLEAKITEAKKSMPPEKALKIIEKLAKKNSIRAGILTPQEQLFEFMDIMNVEWLKKVIENARGQKLIGPIINIINGNHNVHTFEGMIATSKAIARELAIKTGSTEDEILAPILGKHGLYAGEFGIEGHYQWGEYCRHKQGGSKNSRDPTRKMRRAFEEKGQDFPMLKGKYVVNRAGHTHWGGQTTSKNVLHDQCYCFMERNEYGENLNYGSPTRGFKIQGYPVDGPETGPLISIEVPIEYMKKWANEKSEVDVGRLFENSIVKIASKPKKAKPRK